MTVSNAALGPGREFDVIREMLARWGDRAQGIGDDAAILSLPPGEQFVVSTDTSVDDVHFRRAWLSAEEIGYRATAAALSDLAAMAARPLGLLLALVVPDAWLGAVPSLADGVGAAAAATDARIIGGDLSRGAQLSLGVTVIGATRQPLLRSAARPGHLLYVTGALGGPGAALAAFVTGRAPAPEDRARFARPVPRTREAVWLAAHGACAAIDISDGLAADARHIAAASGVTLSIDLDRVPCVASVKPVDAVRSGEEYELLISAPPDADLTSFDAHFGCGLTAIGRVLEDDGRGVITTLGTRGVEITGGYDHFR